MTDAPLRFLTYNVRACEAGIDAIARVIAGIAPDIVALQEVRRGQAELLGWHLSMHAAEGGRLPRSRIRNALLSRAPLEDVRRVRFPGALGRPGRGAVIARTSGLTVASFHLGLRAPERARHARALLRALPPDGALLVGGDVNEGPDGSAARTLRRALTDAFGAAGGAGGDTFPAGAPRARIDLILVRGVRVRACHTEAARASDHLPVVAEVER